MAHTDFEANLVCEGLQLCFPQSISAAIATAAKKPEAALST
jgi:hypothetical protein